MTLRNRQGDESVRYFRGQNLEVDGDGDKSISIFDRPADIKGTAVLTHTHKTGPDDQWLFLPALKRVKRISSANKSGSFVGSEFSYEDMRAPVLEDYSYLWLRDESCPNAPEIQCWVVERMPKDPDSGYRRIVTWIGMEEYRVWQTEFFDRKGAHLKTLSLSDYAEYKDRFWRARRMEMVNHQNGKSTDLVWSAFDFGVPLNDSDFTTRALERVRP